MIWSESFEKELKETRDLIRDIRRHWLEHRQEIDSEQDYNYEKIYETSEVVDNFNPCYNCDQKKGRKKYVTECTYENGKEKGRAFSYCENCGKSMEFDWDDTKDLESGKSNKELRQQQNVQSESFKKGPQFSQQPEKNISGSQMHSH